MKGKTNALVGEPKKKYVMTTIRIDQNISDPATMITRIVDEGGVEAIRANSHRYTGTFADGVMTLKQLDDNDGTKYLDGTAATLTTIGTDVWMKLPRFFWKCTEHATDIWDFSVAYGGKPDDTFMEWDGKDLIGSYKAYVSSSKLYSVSGKIPSVNITQTNFKTYARNRGEGFTLIKWKHHCMMAMLFCAYHNTTNSQNVCGVGISNMSAYSGSTNTLGMADTTTVNSSNGVNFWGLENWWSQINENLDNVTLDATSYFIVEDDNTTRKIEYANLGDGYIRKMLFGKNIDLIPTSIGASATTGFCDSLYYRGTATGITAFLRSNTGNSTEGGVFYTYIRWKADSYASTVTSRLAFRGEIVIES